MDENSAGTIILGVLVFLVFGGLIGWLIYRHIKHTIAGTIAGAKAVKEAVIGAKEEIRIANERKEAGLGWTVPPEMVEKRMANMAGGEEIVFSYSEAPSDEQITSDHKEHAKKTVVAGVVLLVFAGLCVLAGVISGSSSKKMAAYPTVQARIINHTEKIRTDEDGDDYVQHYIDIEWVINGQTYTDTGRPSNEYRKNAITVYYEPGRPDRVYTEAQVQGEGNVYWYVIAGIVGALGLIVAVGGTKKKRKINAE